jgi:hypothetical protein
MGLASLGGNAFFLGREYKWRRHSTPSNQQGSMLDAPPETTNFKLRPHTYDFANLPAKLSTSYHRLD